MYEINVSVFIQHSRYDIFNLLTDVSNYPYVFPFYVGVKRKGDNVWKIKALMKRGIFSINGKAFEWESEFLIDRENCLIYTNEINPRYPLKCLNAKWEIYSINNGVKISLKHYFDIRAVGIIKRILYPLVRIIIKKNSTELLNSIKKYEKRN